jgi:hypothetical protein
VRSAAAGLLIVAAWTVAVLIPWHGPIILALSEQHGVTVADLPAVVLIILAVAIWRPPARERHGLAALAAIGLGALLVVGIFDPRTGGPLVPAGGATLDGKIDHADARSAVPVGRWTHLALTYDGSRYELYMDGAERSARPASGTIRRTADPLWMGGNQPYGEYFHGLVDEVRVYGRALGAQEVRSAMRAPVAGERAPWTRGLEAAYGFDAGHGPTVADASGHGNTGTIRGARWSRAGRYGGALRFDGSDEVVRVPASASMDLHQAMTLMAWVKPSESQSGWRTVLARQTDAYFLTASGGREDAARLSSLNRVRFVLVIALLMCIAVTAGRSWYVPAALFIAGSVLDVRLAPADALIGATLVALWCGATASQRDERVIMYALAGAFSIVTVLSVVSGAFPLRPDDGAVVRASAVGLVLAAAGLVRVRHTAQTRAVGG